MSLFDDFSRTYDLMIDWPARLEAEERFLRAVLPGEDMERVLDCACGTGMHALHLARMGYRVEASDLSPQMIEKAREHAGAEGELEVEFKVADMAALPATHEGPFDLILCLGNSLALTDGREGLRRTLTGMYELLRPGGLAITQVLNFERFAGNEQHFMPLAWGQLDGRTVLFVRIYQFRSEGSALHVVIIGQEGEGWEYSVQSSVVYPWRREDLDSALWEAGFSNRDFYGSMDAAPYDEERSGDLIFVARK